MTKLSREEVHRVAADIDRLYNESDLPSGKYSDDGWLERFAAAIYEAGIKKGKSIPMKYRRMEFNAKLQKELVIERAVSDKLLDALKSIADDVYDSWTNGAVAQDTARLAIAEVETMRKGKPE